MRWPTECPHCGCDLTTTSPFGTTGVTISYVLNFDGDIVDMFRPMYGTPEYMVCAQCTEEFYPIKEENDGSS